MSSQLASCVVTVRPDHFGFNLQTAESNMFQNNLMALGKSRKEIKELALEEFDLAVSVLRKIGIEVIVLDSLSGVVTPDAVFPNNWFSVHEDGILVIYPMFASNRRKERQVDALMRLMTDSGRKVISIVDLSKDELDGKILEGTGSLVLDRVKKYAFAVESPRTSRQEFEKWCSVMNYKGVFYHAVDAEGLPIYHTNVIMALGDGFVVICLDSVKDQKEREVLLGVFEETGIEVVLISQEQVHMFCGNILQLQGKQGKKKIVMSESAMKGFAGDQLSNLRKYGEIVFVSIPTIEKVGGGSARCMLAEVFI